MSSKKGNTSVWRTVAWTAVVVLAFVHATMAGAYAWAGLLVGGTRALTRTALALAVLVAGGIALRAFQSVRRRRLVLPSDALGALLAVLAIGAALLVIDDSTLSGDYEPSDVAPSLSQAAESFRALTAASADPTGDPDAGLRLWIERLDAFPGVTDSPEGLPPPPREANALARRIRQAATAARSHALTLIERGETEAGVTELVRLHSVVRKALAHAASAPCKREWLRAAALSATAAHAAASRTGMPTNQIARLRDACQPLSDEEASLDRVVIADYLVLRGELRAPTGFSRLWSASGTDRSQLLPLRPLYRLTYLPNRTAREVRRRYELALASVRRRPPDPAEGFAWMAENAAHPTYRNLGGWALLAGWRPRFEGLGLLAGQVRVVGDLAALDLHRRTGRELALTDFFGKGLYATDAATGNRFSVGPDGQAGTHDDIALSGPRAPSAPRGSGP
jgi:hypothetical protein